MRAESSASVTSEGLVGTTRRLHAETCSPMRRSGVSACGRVQQVSGDPDTGWKWILRTEGTGAVDGQWPVVMATDEAVAALKLQVCKHQTAQRCGSPGRPFTPPGGTRDPRESQQKIVHTE